MAALCSLEEERVFRGGEGACSDGSLSLLESLLLLLDPDPEPEDEGLDDDEDEVDDSFLLGGLALARLSSVSLHKIKHIYYIDFNPFYFYF